MRILCLSDIHGHADALAAVLAMAERTGYGRILVAGDLCFPGPEPLEVWRRLSQLRAVCVQGSGDRALATVETDALRPRDDFERSRLERLIEVREELGSSILKKLASLPSSVCLPTGAGGQLMLTHGSPQDPLEPLTHDMTDEAMAALIGDAPVDIILCGGSHVPFDRMLAREAATSQPQGGVRVINLGSVGEAPTLNERLAHATFIDMTKGEIHVEQMSVPLGRAA
ncbi:MAG: metallophosphoesterase family protein [Polyangiaceae bacterium]